jgi:threonine synthase
VYRLTLGEAATPLVALPALADRIGVAALWVKRDDLSAGGSHKARSLAYRISLSRARGEKTVLLSSSGNAAVAASLYAAAAGIRLLAFVSPDTSGVKLAPLERPRTTVVRSAKPRNMARYASRVFGIPNLTPSLDPHSVEGFKTIGLELAEEAPEASDFFTFVTSGSSLLGVARSGWGAARHVVQAGSAGRLAAALDPRPCEGPSALAGLLGVDETPRADEVRAAAHRGWVQNDAEIVEAHEWLRNAGIDTSAEGAASLSAVARARREGALDGAARVVVLLTGHGSQWTAGKAGSALEVESYVDLRSALIEMGMTPL